MDFNKEQLEAIETVDKNLRIIACAGSGKTSTISKKIEYILNPSNSLHIKPNNIIAFTYTEKAAAELKNKILKFISDEPNLNGIQGLADMYIGTIHGWCLKALQNNEYGYQKFSVLDDIKLRLFVDKNYDNIGMKEIYKLTDPDVCMQRYIDTGRFVQLMNIIRESDKSKRLPKHIEKALNMYKSTLRENSYFDFSMIMTETIDKLEPSTYLHKYIKENLKYLIVDEYQDINPIQESLIEKLFKISNCHISVVGDDDQNIYQWRGSNNAFILNFTNKYPNVHQVTLNKNYRSSKGITTLAQKLISHNSRREAKRMVSDDRQLFTKNEDILYNESETIYEENLHIANTIKNLLGTAFKDDIKENTLERGLALSDFCILLRTWNKAQAITEVFDTEGIKYITAGVNQLFETKEVMAAMGIFHYLYKTIDSDELSRLWGSIPTNDIKKQNLKIAIQNLDQHNPNFREKWDYSLQEIFWGFLNDAQILEDKFQDPERAEIIFYNLGKFSQVINDFEEINLNTFSPSYHLFNFLNFIKYAAVDYYPEGWINNEYKKPDAVQIMTIHQAKGLEFPVIFIPGMNKNYLPSKKRGGLNEWHFLDKKLIVNQERYEGDDDNEDERRLLYVAITRSQKYLFISRAPDEKNRLYQKESLFIEELNSSEILVESNDEDFRNKIRLNPLSKEKVNNILLNFTVLKDFFECSYRFKLTSMYGFCYPLNTRMGLGRSLHNCLMEINKRSHETNEVIKESEIDLIVKRQAHFPYMSPLLKEEFEKIVLENTLLYFRKYRDSLKDIQFVEQDIQLDIGNGILVNGRIDLIKKKKYENVYETYIVEFKSDTDPKYKKITTDQLNLYALGHKELTGQKADYIQIFDVSNIVEKTPIRLKDSHLSDIKGKIQIAATNIRKQLFTRVIKKDICTECFQQRICSARLNLNLEATK